MAVSTSSLGDPSSTPATGTRGGPVPEDWPSTAASTIERVVASVRAKTADPLEKLGRAVVYGLLAAILGVAAAVLGIAFVVRLLVVLLDLALPHQRAVWVAELVLGGIFVLAGLFSWGKRRATK